MTNAQWRKAVELLQKGKTVWIDDQCIIVPWVDHNGNVTDYSLRTDEGNCIICTWNLDHIKRIVVEHPERKKEANQ